ncbi:MAG: DegT/DnrJ/EryC1/StrS family aminotransferase, partial [Planctomycetota bacterium]
MSETKVPFVDLRAQYRSLKEELDAAARGVLERSAFILGKEVEAFEKEFAEFLGVPHAVGVSSGLDALRLSLTALGVGPGDEVLLPANTYIATALAVSAAGAGPVLVEMEEERCGMDPAAFEKAAGPRAKAVIPVHLYGRACRLGEIMDAAKKRGLVVVEDACQVHGARYEGKSCGTIGDAGCFSFYPSKNLGAAGDGGMIVTHSGELAAKLRVLRDY